MPWDKSPLGLGSDNRGRNREKVERSMKIFLDSKYEFACAGRYGGGRRRSGI